LPEDVRPRGSVLGDKAEPADEVPMTGSNGRFQDPCEDRRWPRKSLEKRREKALAGIV
jgi:hypothetical protein